MKPNPVLESVQIFVRMISTIYEVRGTNQNYDNMQEDTVWIDGRFAKYKRAFQALHSLNSNLQLRIKDDQSYLLHLFVSTTFVLTLTLFLDH